MFNYVSYLTVVVLSILLVSSCSNVGNAITVNRTDEVIATYEGVSISGAIPDNENYIATEPELCIRFDQRIFWQPGNYWYSFEDLPQVIITFDNKVIPYHRRSADAILIEELSPDSEVIGAHSNWFEYCILIDNQMIGQKTLSVEIIVNSEHTHQYHWRITSEQ